MEVALQGPEIYEIF